MEMRYKEIVRAIEKSIKDENLEFGDKLPSQNEYARQFGVSRKTLWIAVRELMNRGVIYSRQGKGMFVGKPECTLRTVICLVPTLGVHGNFQAIMAKLDDISIREGLQIVQVGTHHSASRTIEFLRSIDQKNLAGVVYTPLAGVDERSNGDIIDIISSKTDRIILLDRKIEQRKGWSFVGAENFEASKNLTERLIAHDYSSYIFAKTYDLPTVNERLAGFHAALAAHDVPDERIYEISLPYESFRRVKEKTLELAPNGVGIFAANEQVAHRIYVAMLQAHVDVPGHVGIVGYDNTLSLAYQPTTAEPDYELMAEEIAKLLGETGSRDVCVPANVIDGVTA